MTEQPQLDPLPDGVLDKLRQVSTSTIATQLYKRGFRQPQLLGVRPISQVTDGFVAEAFTMRFIPAREDVNTLDPYRSGNTLQWDAIESVPPGHIIDDVVSWAQFLAALQQVDPDIAVNIEHEDAELGQLEGLQFAAKTLLEASRAA